jgi:excisionase family DNA binding protein
MLIAELLRERHSAITVPELAHILHVSPRQLYKLAETNRIPNFRIGTSVRFDPDAILHWLEDKEITSNRQVPRPHKIQYPRSARVA